MNLGFRIKHLRIEKELTQEELANMIGMKKPTVSLYESNSRQPDYETLMKIADVFGVTIDGLLGRGDLFPLTKEEKRFLDCFRSFPAREREDVWSYMQFLKTKKA